MILRLFAVCLFFAAPAGALTLQLRDAEVADRVVRLGDVAIVSGVPRDLADSLSASVVAFAPMPGASRPVPVETIRVRVLQAGFLPGEVRITGNAPLVRRAGQRLDAAAVERAVLEALAPLGDESTALRVTRVPAMALLPAGTVRVSVEPPDRLERTFHVPVQVAVGEERFSIQVGVAATQLVTAVFPARRIERGEVIGTTDVVVRTIDRFDAPRGLIGAAGDVVGCAALRPLLPDLALAEGMIQRPSAVRRGERVRLVSAFGPLEVSVSAEALEPGTPGQRIRVRNTESRRIITARVRGAGEVIVDEL